jgi:ABC-type uncharacterized transport system fused permease/ATPase subunit
VIYNIVTLLLDYISNRRLLLSIADAGGRLMYAYKDLLELAGLTTRVYTLLSTLHALPAIKDFVESDHVELDGVGVSIPERKVRGANMFESEDSSSRNYGLGGSLVEPLKIVISKGDHLMITGPVSIPCVNRRQRLIALHFIRTVWARPRLHESSPDYGSRMMECYAAR